MNRQLAPRLIRTLYFILAPCAFWLCAQPAARAGLSLEMNLVRYSYQDNRYWYFSPNLNTNANPPAVPFGTYYVVSPGYPTNGATAMYSFTSSGFNETTGGSGGFNDFDAPDFNSSFIKSLTNGQWSIFVTNTVTTNVYHFNVTANISTNDLPDVVITFPPYGATNVPSQPTFTWQGPTDYDDIAVYEQNYSAVLAADQTSWQSPIVLNDGPNFITVHYDKYPAGTVVSSTPVDSLSNPISSWVSTAHLQDYFTSDYTVGTLDTAGTGHSLVAHYPFDATSGAVLDAAVDTSGNGYDMSFGGGFGSQGGSDLTSDSAAGIGAVQFHNGDGGSAGYLGWSQPTPAPLLSALAGSFSISCWLKTSQSFGNDNDQAYNGAGIVSADNPGLDNDLIPLALTGSKVGFNTGGDVQDDTVNSVTGINDGNYHHVVVTRNQTTGQKVIYIDGVLDTFSSGTTNLLNAPQKLTIGALADASNPDPNDGSYYNGYDGLLDDLQIYSGVLSSNEVAELYANPGSTAPNRAAGAGGPVVHYDFDEGTVLATDVTGNGNNMVHAGNFGGGGPSLSSDTAAGSGSISFDGGSYLTASANLLPTLAGEFSLSLWLKTSQSFGNQGDPAWAGAGVVCADSPNAGAKDLVPVALTGGQVAFNIGDGSFDDTLNSAATVNDGAWHHVVVTRDLTTGNRQIYIDGSLDSSEVSSTVLLNTPVLLTIGAKADASNSDPTSPDYTGSNGYQGLLDDIQLYDRVLTDGEIAFLYQHPGASIAGGDFGTALGTTNLPWSTSGDAPWFVETTNTQDGVSAAQSGSVTDFQSSTLSVTVTGPGTLSFYWSSIAEDPNQGFDYEFDIDGNYQNDIWGDTSWYQDGPYTIDSGTHTLTWTVYANGDTDPAQAGFLDQVSFVVSSVPVITLNPFDQTNYPGYSVALLAAATSNVAVTWQWFEVGNGSPIPNATNALFIPINSGTASVAGSYYAVASNPSGSTPTAAATVSFVNTPLPTDWSRAFKSPSFNNNTLTEEYYLAALPDSAGDLYAAGSFTGTNTIGAQTFISANGAYETELVKQTATGTLLWAVAMTNNGQGTSEAQAVAPAPGDGIYVLGNFNGTNWLGTNQVAESGGNGMYLARFDANGNNLWIRTVTSASNVVFTGFNCAAADPSGTVTISGLIGGWTTFSSTSSGTSTNLLASGQVGALAQYDANGKLLWAGMPGAWVLNLAYGGGRLYGSMFSPTAGFSGITNVTDRRYTLAAINPTNGQAIWLRGVGAPQNEGNPLGIILDIPLISIFGTDVTIVGVAYGSNATFGPYTVSWNADAGQYFARYDTNGTPQLATSFGSATTQLYATLPDASGNIYVDGDFDTYSTFGNDILAAPHEDSIGNGYVSHAFLAKFDRNGNPLWARPAVAQNNYVNFRSLAVVPDGVWACGACKSPTAFGTNTVDSALTCIGSPFCTLTYHTSGVFGKITDSVPVALAVTLLNPDNNGVSFQFSFQSQSGFTHAVQYRTNLVTGSNWQTYSNVVGDGALKTIPVPLSVFSPSPQGFIRVSTH